MKQKIVYYEDEINDDFFTGKKYEKINIDENYNFLPKNIFSKIGSFLLYYLVAMPCLLIYMFLIQGVRVKGKNKLKSVKKQGYLVVGNHTHYTDAYVAQIGVTLPKRTYVIANDNAVQLPLVGNLVRILGGLPTPKTISGLKNFKNAVDSIFKNNCAISVFPEAHIWPYYTGLRPFPLTCFKLAAKNKVPIVPIATVYKKRMLIKKPKAVIYVGNPIFFDNNLTETQNAEYYRNMSYKFIYDTINKQDNYVYIKYVKKTKDNTDENNFCNA